MTFLRVVSSLFLQPPLVSIRVVRTLKGRQQKLAAKISLHLFLYYVNVRRETIFKPVSEYQINKIQTFSTLLVMNLGFRFFVALRL